MRASTTTTTKNGRKTGSTTADMTCAADPPPGPATPDENPNRHLTRHPRHHPPGTGHASRARSHRRTYQRPQRVVAQALRHRPGGDARSSACQRWFSRRRRRRRLTERPTMRYEAGRARRRRPAPERRVGLAQDRRTLVTERDQLAGRALADLSWARRRPVEELYQTSGVMIGLAAQPRTDLPQARRQRHLKDCGQVADHPG